MKYCKVSRYQYVEEPDPKNPAAKIVHQALVPVKRHMTWEEAKFECRKDRTLEIGPDCAPPIEEIKEVPAGIM